MSIRWPLDALAVLVAAGVALSCSESSDTTLGPEEPLAKAAHGDIPAPTDLKARADPYGVIEVAWSWGDDVGWDLVSFTPLIDGDEAVFTDGSGSEFDVERKDTQGGVVYSREGTALAPAQEPGSYEVCIEVMAKDYGEKPALTHHSVGCTTVEVVWLAPPSLTVQVSPTELKGLIFTTWSDPRDWPSVVVYKTLNGTVIGVNGKTPYPGGFLLEGISKFPRIPGTHAICAWVEVGMPGSGIALDPTWYSSETICVDIEVPAEPEIAPPTLNILSGMTGTPTVVTATWSDDADWDFAGVAWNLTPGTLLSGNASLGSPYVAGTIATTPLLEGPFFAAGTYELCARVHVASGTVTKTSPDICETFVVPDLPWTSATYDGHQYALTPLPMTWEHAKHLADVNGVHLVTLNSAAEESWLQDPATGFPTATSYWTGFNDMASEGTWVWESGEAVTYVHPDFAPNGGVSENAAAMNQHSTLIWDDLPLHYELFAILERAAP